MAQITLKSGELRTAFEVINTLVTDRATGAARRWPAKFSYWLARMVTKLQTEYETTEKARIALAEEFGVKTPDGTQYEFTAESGPAFAQRFNDILSTDINLELPQVSASALENVEIEPAVLLALDKFIVE